MQFALVNNVKVESFSGGRGECPQCKSPVIAKCGPRIIHHWAHYRSRNCDPWWENETLWHRAWKARFPDDCLEISHEAEDGEIHRADIKTPTGIVIEVQHSAISDSERCSREKFYKNLIWIVDGSTFAKNFQVCHFLPDPNSDLAQDLRWCPAGNGLEGSNDGLFFRPSEAIANSNMQQVHGIREIKDEIMRNWIGHSQYWWRRPKKTWLDSSCPVYIDFGDQFLYRLELYGDTGLRCVRMIAKDKLVHDAMVETDATQIAERFYPIHGTKP